MVNEKKNENNRHGKLNVERKLYSNKCKRKVQKDWLRNQAEYNSEWHYRQKYPDLMMQLTGVTLVHRNMNNARRKCQPLPYRKLITKTVNALYSKTDNNDQFLLINHVDLHSMIFSCGHHAKLIPIVFMDGTFEYCSKFFVRLFSLHSPCNKHYIINLLAPLPDKKEHQLTLIY